MNDALGPIRQLGYVVEDIQEAMDHWIKGNGVGPFYLMEKVALTDFVYLGEKHNPNFSAAMAQCGSIQIELLQLHDETPSAFRTFANECGHGLQHIAFWTDRFDAATDWARQHGWSEIQTGKSGRGRPDDRFAYYDRGAHHGSIVEISEMGEEKRQLFDAIRRAGDGWDGSRPVRDMKALLEEVAAQRSNA